MANDIASAASQDDVQEIKPAYRRPVLTELDVEETATGVQNGPTENISYIS
ncbi:hypothetical protein ABIE65_000360 [Constrictibacter sp. MBR-5]|jgi:hypothetical protein|uniref:hypothetical protein n=1 Tax=Constrictibacter sp. MBR-5 TaxID=3156467 RepID=UPI00339404C1